MSQWYFAVIALMLSPALVAAQGFQNSGGSSGSSFQGGSGGSISGGSISGGSQSGTVGNFGKPNTTMLGAQVDLGFNGVFGTAPSIANTNADPFAPYRPSDTGTTSSSLTGGYSGTGGFGTSGRSNSAGRTNSLAGSSLSNGVTGGNFGAQNRTGTLTGAGNFGGGGNLTGNRFGATGGQLGGMNRGGMTGNLAGNRGMTFGNNFLGGGMNFLGSSNFLGGNMNQANQPAPMGYTVNFIPAGGSSVTTAAPVPAGPTLTVHIEARDRLANAPALQGSQNFQVLMAGDVAVLRGTVPSDNAKRLAAALALLEPGVYRVDNQLVVASPLPAPQPVK